MPQDHHNSIPTMRRLAFYWHLACRCYRHLNLATHHLLGAAFKLLVLCYFVFGVLFLALRYTVLPNIDRYKSDVEHIVSRTIGQSVKINTIYASWKGLRPHLFFGGVAIYDKNGREALKLPGVTATLSWWSVPFADIRLDSLEIIRPDVDIQRDAKGNLFVAGVFIDTKKNSDGKGADWILSQSEIVVRDGRLRWNDGERKAPELALDGINFVLRNNWHHHQFALKANPPAILAAPIDVRADFNHPHFTKKISDFTQWTGELYVDLQQADLAAWKSYVDYPIEVERGKGALRVWFNFNNAKIADFTADLSASNVSAKLRNHSQQIQLAQVQGRIAVKEDFDPQKIDPNIGFGGQGHSISLINFSLQTDDGLILPATTISETYTPAQKNQLEKTEITAQSLDLRALANLAEHFPLTDEKRQILLDFAPSGFVKNLSAKWQGAYPEVTSYNVKGEFTGLSLKAQAARPAQVKTAKSPARAAVPAIPGFEHLTGRVEANDQGGIINLMSEKFTLHLPGYFSDPVRVFDQLNMRASWAFQAKDLVLFEVGKMDFVQEGLVASLSGKYVFPMTAQLEKSLGAIDMTAHINKLNLNHIGHYLPIQTPEELRNWLTGALRGGVAKDVDIKVKGDLAQFPFQVTSLRDKLNGQFSVLGKIENGKLEYVPGSFGKEGNTPLWPLLEEVNGTISFDRNRMEIKADRAKTHGVELSNVKAVIPDLLSNDLLLQIDGNAEGVLQEFLAYTVDSPVSDWIARFTDETKASGNAKLRLKMALPLDHMSDAKVQGSLQFVNNDVTLQNAMPPLLATTGKLEFNERGLTISGVKANFLGGPVTISGGSQRDGSLVIKAEGIVSSAGLRRTYQTPAIKRLSERITGGTRFNATVSVKKKQPEIIVESNLQGVAIDFPAPLRKTATEILPLKFELNALPEEDAKGMRDEMKLTLGPAISARYIRQKFADKSAKNAPAWKLISGGIGVNVPAPEPESGLVANMNIKSLNMDDWSNAVSEIIGADKKKISTVANVEDALNIAQYIEPDVLAARATELFVLGKKLDNVVVGASHQKGTWQTNIDSEQASGYVTWNGAAAGQTIGKVTARLATLVVQKSAANDVSDLLEGKHTSTQIPSLDIVADNFELFGKKLGHLEVLANNVQGSSIHEWRIAKLSLANPDAELKASGKWSIKEGENISNLIYALDIENAGKLLDRLGFNNVLRGGKGKMEGDLSWKGLPFALDIPSLSGQLKLDIASGQFLKVEPGAAKLLGVLSLQALPRRLTLDFRDVFSEGFSFDGVTATAAINQGVAKTDNFKMRSVNATVLLDGVADIAKESQSLHVVVLPEINAGAASVVYALAVNPIVGVGTFLAQLFLREPLVRAFTYEYKITGPWKDPVVTKLERKDGEASQSSVTTSDSVRK